MIISYMRLTAASGSLYSNKKFFKKLALNKLLMNLSSSQMQEYFEHLNILIFINAYTYTLSFYAINLDIL